MKTNEANEQSSHQQEPLASASHEEIASVVAPPLSRRSFFGRVGASTALAAATGAGLPSLLLSKKAAPMMAMAMRTIHAKAAPFNCARARRLQSEKSLRHIKFRTAMSGATPTSSATIRKGCRMTACWVK